MRASCSVFFFFFSHQFVMQCADAVCGQNTNEQTNRYIRKIEGGTATPKTPVTVGRAQVDHTSGVACAMGASLNQGDDGHLRSPGGKHTKQLD